MQIVKKRLEKERDLEGIDLENIVSGGRRSRTNNTASVSYKCACSLRMVVPCRVMVCVHVPGMYS